MLFKAKNFFHSKPHVALALCLLCLVVFRILLLEGMNQSIVFAHLFNVFQVFVSWSFYNLFFACIFLLYIFLGGLNFSRLDLQSRFIFAVCGIAFLIIALFGRENFRYFLTIIPLLLVLADRFFNLTLRWTRPQRNTMNITFLLLVIAGAMPHLQTLRRFYDGSFTAMYRQAPPYAIVEELRSLPLDAGKILICSAPIVRFLIERPAWNFTAYSTYGAPRRGVFTEKGIDNIFDWSLGEPLRAENIKKGLEALRSYGIEWVVIREDDFGRFPEMVRLLQENAAYYFLDKNYRLYSLAPQTDGIKINKEAKNSRLQNGEHHRRIFPNTKNL